MSVSREAQGLSLSHPSQGSGLRVPRAGDSAQPVFEAKVWADRVAVQSCGDAAAAWFSELCGQALRLVRLADAAERRVDTAYDKQAHHTGLTDGFPLLVVNLASLRALNLELENSINILRFRPNVIVDSGEPWSEDRWAGLHIGAHRFATPKPCTRCKMIHVDPQRGAPAAGTSPLRKLAKLRKDNSFGLNALHPPAALEPVHLRLGDPVVADFAD